MKPMIALVVALITFTASPAHAEIAPEKRALIDTLLEQTGASATQVADQFSTFFVQQMTAALQQTNPNVDPKAFQIIEEETRAVIQGELDSGNDLGQLIYPIYDEHFSAGELEKIIAFNKTELGQKMIEVMPSVTQASIRAGQQWGQSVAPKLQQRVLKRFEEEGIQ